MLRFAAFITIFVQFSFSHAQQVIPLSIIKGGNVDFKINATPPFSLYVSAHGDSSDLLRQIFVKTQNNQMKSLDALKHAKPNANSGLLTPFLAQSTAYVSSNLNDEQMKSLGGFIYITTTKQASDNCFRVYDVDQSQIIKTERAQDGNCTLVFLNTNAQTFPVQSSTISNWHQSPDAIVKMYRGFPNDNEELSNSQLFSNPISTINASLFIPTVEKFTVSLGTFYFKTTNDFYFNIEPIFTDLDGYATSGYHSTGFYMKSRLQIPKKVTILCVRDTRFNGTTGANVVGSLPDKNGKVLIGENNGPTSIGWEVNPVNQILAWTVDSIGESLTITSQNSNGGEFFVQYFMVQGQQISSTFAPTIGTTQSVETTTKSSRGVNFIGATSILAILCLVL